MVATEHDPPEEQVDDQETEGTEEATEEPVVARAPRPVAEEEDFSGPFRGRTPDRKNKEMFGIADQLVGGSRIKVNCEDGRARLGRIPGKMKRRMWIRTGDLLIIKPWDFQDDKCDIKYRYMRIQSIHLSRRKMIPESLDIF